MIMKLFNRFAAFILRSPLHWLMSASTLLITVRGRKSGREITTPVNYAIKNGRVLVTSDQSKRWWKNLRTSLRVKIVVQRKIIECDAQLLELGAPLFDALEDYCAALPASAKFMKVQKNAEGSFNRESIQTASIGRVMVVCDLPAEDR